MLIANPLYDHAFKYLMSNERLARKILTLILEKEVLQVDLAQQELVVEDHERTHIIDLDEENRLFTTYRLDLKALILDESGRQEWVLIELQKSRLPTNIMRFRTYLGQTYMQRRPKAGVAEEEIGDYASESIYPIITVYILGYKLSDIPAQAVKIDRKVINLANHEEMEVESDFVDLLTHTVYVLQVGRLPEKRRTKLEQFLSLFDQRLATNRRYILELDEIPEGVEDIATYLQQPLQDPGIRKRLRDEADMEDIFAHHEATVTQLIERVERTQDRADEAEQKMEEAEQKKEEAEREKEEAEREKEEAEREKEEAEREKEEAEREKEEAEREKEEAEREKEEAEREKEEAEREKEEAEREKEEAERRKEEAERRKEEAEREKEEAIRREKETEMAARSAKIKLARLLLSMGKEMGEVVRETGLSSEEIEHLSD